MLVSTQVSHRYLVILVGLLLSEIGIYKDNLSAIVIAIIYCRLSLSHKIVLIYRLPILFVLYFVIADKRFLTRTVFKVSKLALWKKYTASIKSCYNSKKCLFVLFNATIESVNCSLILKNLKTFL